MGVEVFEGNPADPAALSAEISRFQQRLGSWCPTAAWSPVRGPHGNLTDEKGRVLGPGPSSLGRKGDSEHGVDLGVHELRVLAVIDAAYVSYAVVGEELGIAEQQDRLGVGLVGHGQVDLVA